MDGVVKENPKGAEGLSEAGLEANEKLEDPEPKGVDPPREKADGAMVDVPVTGTEKVNPTEETAAVEPMLKGEAEEEAAGAWRVEAAPEERSRFGNVAGMDGIGAGILGGCVAKEPVNRKYIWFQSIHNLGRFVNKNRLVTLEVNHPQREVHIFNN